MFVARDRAEETIMSNEANDAKMNPDATPGTPRDVVDPGQLPGASGMTAAGGNSVLNTGRPTRPDARAAIGGEPHTGRTMPDRDNAQSIRSAAGTTGLGTIGGGTAGTGASGTLDRAADITGDAASAPNFVGANPGQRQDAQIADDEATALQQEMRDARAAMRDAGAPSGRGGNPSKRPAD
jgi:hypothetical protein